MGLSQLLLEVPVSEMPGTLAEYVVFVVPHLFSMVNKIRELEGSNEEEDEDEDDEEAAALFEDLDDDADILTLDERRQAAKAAKAQAQGPAAASGAHAGDEVTEEDENKHFMEVTAKMAAAAREQAALEQPDTAKASSSHLNAYATKVDDVNHHELFLQMISTLEQRDPEAYHAALAHESMAELGCDQESLGALSIYCQAQSGVVAEALATAEVNKAKRAAKRDAQDAQYAGAFGINLAEVQAAEATQQHWLAGLAAAAQQAEEENARTAQAQSGSLAAAQAYAAAHGP